MAVKTKQQQDFKSAFSSSAVKYNWFVPLIESDLVFDRVIVIVR